MEEKSKISTIVNFDDVFHELPDVDVFNIWRRTLNSTEERDAPEKFLFTLIQSSDQRGGTSLACISRGEGLRYISPVEKVQS